MRRRYTREDLLAAVENAMEIAAIVGPLRFYNDLRGLLTQINNQKKDD